MAHTTVVFNDAEHVDQQPISHLCHQEGTDSPQERRHTHPCTQTKTSGMQSIREQFIEYNISEGVTNVLMSSWRDGTQKQYSVYNRKWHSFCIQETLDPLHPTVNEVLNFLHCLYVQKLPYSTIFTHKCDI